MGKGHAKSMKSLMGLSSPGHRRSSEEDTGDGFTTSLFRKNEISVWGEVGVVGSHRFTQERLPHLHDSQGRSSLGKTQDE